MTQVETIAEQIKGMTPSQQLRFAADLLELAQAEPSKAARLLNIVHSTISLVSTEVGAVIAILQAKDKPL